MSYIQFTDITNDSENKDKQNALRLTPIVNNNSNTNIHEQLKKSKPIKNDESILCECGCIMLFSKTEQHKIKFVCPLCHINTYICPHCNNWKNNRDKKL